jgi:hypothetical protein
MKTKLHFKILVLITLVFLKILLTESMLLYTKISTSIIETSNQIEGKYNFSDEQAGNVNKPSPNFELELRTSFN